MRKLEGIPRKQVGRFNYEAITRRPEILTLQQNLLNMLAQRIVSANVVYIGFKGLEIRALAVVPLKPQLTNRSRLDKFLACSQSAHQLSNYVNTIAMRLPRSAGSPISVHILLVNLGFRV